MYLLVNLAVIALVIALWMAVIYMGYHMYVDMTTKLFEQRNKRTKYTRFSDRNDT